MSATTAARWTLALVTAAGAMSAATASADSDVLDPCIDPLVDPVVTPLRDAALDGQRGACLRDELAARLGASALIDTPEFHGVIGGDLRLVGRLRVGDRLELGLDARAVRYTFAQTAVTQATELGLGPLGFGLAYGGELGGGARVALIGRLELPYTRNELGTTRVAGALGVAVTAALAPRWALVARLGAIAAAAASAGGTTGRLALRAGADVSRRLGRSVAVHGGADLQAGWYGGLDHVLVRAGVHLRLGPRWRLPIGIGIPTGGDERITAVLDLGIVHDGW